MSLQIGARGLEVREGRLRRHEVQLHEPARRVIDVDQQRARLGPVLEPSVVAAIDLDQLADARAAVPRLVDLGCSLATRLPQASLNHQPADRLLAERHAVKLTQLLASQRRAEVGVALPDQGNRSAGDAVIELVVAGPSTLRGDQPRGSAGLVSLDQSLELPATDPQPFSCLTDPQHPIDESLDFLQPVELAHAHRDARCDPRHARPQ